MPDKKKKKRVTVSVNRKVVIEIVNEIARKLTSLKHGYMVNDELDKLRELVK